MTNLAKWTSPSAWTTGINSSDLVSMATGKVVLSTVADIANGTNLDLLMDVSVRVAIASNTIVAGANLALYLYYLLDDGSTYGDGQLTAGTQTTTTPVVRPCGSIDLVPGTQTTLVGIATRIEVAPGSFRLALMNNSGFALTAGTQTVKYRTYEFNMNA